MSLKLDINSKKLNHTKKKKKIAAYAKLTHQLHSGENSMELIAFLLQDLSFHFLTKSAIAYR